MALTLVLAHPHLPTHSTVHKATHISRGPVRWYNLQTFQPVVLHKHSGIVLADAKSYLHAVDILTGGFFGQSKQDGKLGVWNICWTVIDGVEQVKYHPGREGVAFTISKTGEIKIERSLDRLGHAENYSYAICGRICPPEPDDDRPRRMIAVQDGWLATIKYTGTFEHGQHILQGYGINTHNAMHLDGGHATYSDTKNASCIAIVQQSQKIAQR